MERAKLNFYRDANKKGTGKSFHGKLTGSRLFLFCFFARLRRETMEVRDGGRFKRSRSQILNAEIREFPTNVDVSMVSRLSATRKSYSHTKHRKSAN